MRLRRSDKQFAHEVARAIVAWEDTRNPLPGLTDQRARDCLVGQLVASDRTRRFIEHYRYSIRLTERQMDPNSGVFDPFAAAVLHHRRGDLDEALWLSFLATHFGRHPEAGWRYTERVYGRLGEGRWDWRSVSTNVGRFRVWLSVNADLVKGTGRHGFGNHRKRESLSNAGTGQVVQSYVSWIDPGRSHEAKFAEIVGPSIETHAAEFENLYRSMTAVHRFGRLARFDYLSTASRLGLTTAVAGRAYLPGSTGPLEGARLLFGKTKPLVLEDAVIQFGKATGIPFAVIEDALCNWQKSPYQFKYFRG